MHVLYVLYINIYIYNLSTILSMFLYFEEVWLENNVCTKLGNLRKPAWHEAILHPAAVVLSTSYARVCDPGDRFALNLAPHFRQA